MSVVVPIETAECKSDRGKRGKAAGVCDNLFAATRKSLILKSPAVSGASRTERCPSEHDVLRVTFAHGAVPQTFLTRSIVSDIDVVNARCLAASPTCLNTVTSGRSCACFMRASTADSLAAVL